MPGILGGFGGIVSSALAGSDYYGETIGKVFPARAPSNATLAALLGVNTGHDRTASWQAAYQAFSLMICVGFGIIGGIVAGVILRWSCCEPLSKDEMFDDEPFWEVPSESHEEIHLKKSKKKKTKKVEEDSV